MTHTTQEGLVRKIGRWDLLALVTNSIVGAGIFGLPSKLYALAGDYSLWAFMACAFFIGLLIICFAEVASRFSETGGPFLYANTAFGAQVGFQVGWLMWLTRLTAFAALCNLLVNYLSYFVPAASDGITRAAIITALVAALAAVNIIGVRQAAVVSNIFTVSKLIPLFIFVTVGLFFVGPERYTFEQAPSLTTFSDAVLLLVFAFSGFEVAVIPAGEVHNPQRNVPFALFTSLAAVTLLYFLIQVVCIGALPTLAASDRPLADAAERFLGAAGASLMTLGALISIAGTLNTGMLAAPRLIFAMAERRELPAFFAATHPRFHTPHRAILVSAALMLAFSLFATFLAALKISTLIRLLIYAVTCLSLIALRRKHPQHPAAFTIPGGIGLAIAVTLLSLWLIAHSSREEIYMVGGAALLGGIISLAARFWRKR